MREEYFTDKTWQILNDLASNNLVRTRCSKAFREAIEEEMMLLFLECERLQKKEASPEIV